MLTVKKITYSNFLSTGNAGITIEFDKFPTVLVQGMSGSGKSTMIDALCFGLYGKPFRNINKPGLVNSINQKQSLVEIEFVTNGVTYKIIRGIKPNLFEIYANGTMINQNAALKDYQKVLEQQILRMTMKTFTQIAILGSSSYTPFMELPAAGRREVIEDILDIGIFSVMNNLLKIQAQETKEQQVKNDADLNIYKERAKTLQKLIEILTNKQNDEIGEIQELIKTLQEEFDGKREEQEVFKLANIDILANVPEISDHTIWKKNLSENQNKISEFAAEKRQYKKNLDFFNQKDICPTCNQGICADHKNMTIELYTGFLVEANKKISELEIKQKSIVETINRIEIAQSDIDSNIYGIKSLDNSIQMIERQLEQNINKLKEKKAPTADVSESQKELKECAKGFLLEKDRKKQLATEREIQEAASSLLKDSGIKTAIIREYLPLINKLLNNYLQQMELFVDFHLDESFNEVIKSRYRDIFCYGNFSAGEQLRISLAILFTWRHIAKLKNSAACNILIFDEILTGKLDNQNTDILINMINDIASNGTNIFVIAHGDALHDKMTSSMRFEKQGDFSVLMS